jgi:hypothetical protein
VNLYSVRFIAYYGANGALTYQVPAGKRAVVRDVTVASYVAGTSVGAVRVATFAVWAAQLTGAYQSAHVDCRWVAYGGEVIEASTGTVACSVFVNGYLFEDPPGSPRTDVDSIGAPAEFPPWPV